MKKLSSIALCLVLALGFATLVACEQEPAVENMEMETDTMAEPAPATGMEAEGEAMEEMGEEMQDDSMGAMDEQGEMMEEQGEEMQDAADDMAEPDATAPPQQ